MAEKLKQTKIPRFDSATPVTARIPKPSFVRPAAPIGISKLARPQSTGIASKPRTELNSTTTEPPKSIGTALPRKTFIRRFSAANKVPLKSLPRLLSKNPLKPSQLVVNGLSAHDGCALNDSVELTKDGALDVTKPVIKAIDTEMDRSLTRSNTFVCESDDLQVKLLSITHNVNEPIANDTFNKSSPLNKERTFKRSLSPIPGEVANSAKRKVMQVTSKKGESGPVLISTPRRSMSYSDARKANLTFFGAKSVDLSEPQVGQLQTFTCDTTFEQSSFSPDASKLGRAMSSTMQSNRVFDLTQTVENEPFYPEKRNATQTLDVNAAEHELKNGDASKLNVSANVNDGNLTKTITVEKSQPIQIVGSGPLNDDLLTVKKRFSLGLELPDCTLDCSIELCDSSAATSVQDSSPLVHYNTHSYDMDESLGILTPDQMIEFLDTNATHAKLELPTSLPVKIDTHKCRIDQTPSPEDLPLDPIEVTILDTSKEDADVTLQPSQICDLDGPSQADSYSKNDQMTKSSTSKVTNSFITSVTSIASLDNGYHADGEMSRPASRGAESPMRRVHSVRQNKGHGNDAHDVAVVRRQDPLTDSDFFTESDADDIFHRGDRRVQIIDGHMYNAQGADVFIDEAPPENEMESSGVYTDVEHRADDDVPLNRTENESDMSPDCSTDTIKSSEYANDSKAKPKTDLDNTKSKWPALPTQSTQSIAAMSNSSSTTNDSVATCLCEKPSGNGGDHAQLVISDASGNNEKSSCKLHSISRTDDKTAAPQFKTNSPKVKRFSPNRKQCKSDTAAAHKRIETPKRDAKSSVRNRSSAIGAKK